MAKLATVALLLLAAATARAAGDHELLAAEQELKIAKDHLQAAPPEYEGHRREAIQAIDQALREIRQAIDFAREHRGEPPVARKPKGKPTEREPAPDDTD
jgi:hypothetical protein